MLRCKYDELTRDNAGSISAVFSVKTDKDDIEQRTMSETEIHDELAALPDAGIKGSVEKNTYRQLYMAFDAVRSAKTAAGLPLDIAEPCV